ncbi:MAG: hypothetical protein HYZ46_09385 [Nitrosomonadales bacterium]|nr:hypothetical protein [Nitrosomonadales bacterium]
MGKRTFRTALLTLILALSGVSALAKTPPAKPSPVKAPSAKSAASDAYGKTVIARVGQREITREDLIHMVQIEQAYRSNISEAEALLIVMSDAIFAEVARSVGVEIPAAEVPTHFPIIDQFTPANPAVLQESLPANKQPFHVSHADYAKLYLVPRMIYPKMRLFYLSGSNLNQPERAKLERVMQLVKDGKTFSEAAQQTGLTVARKQLTEKEINLPEGLLGKLPENRNLPQNPIFSALNQLSSGQIIPEIIEDERGLRLIQLLSRTGTTYNIAVIDIPKPPFDTWLQQRTQNLSISVSDTRLKNALKAAYANRDWVNRLQ